MNTSSMKNIERERSAVHMYAGCFVIDVTGCWASGPKTLIKLLSKLKISNNIWLAGKKRDPNGNG
jgi:hypothetical protein